jgi:hypothetical protein
MATTSRIALYVSVLLGGLFAGFLVGVLVLANSLRSFGASVYTQIREVSERPAVPHACPVRRRRLHGPVELLGVDRNVDEQAARSRRSV